MPEFLTLMSLAWDICEDHPGKYIFKEVRGELSRIEGVNDFLENLSVSVAGSIGSQLLKCVYALECEAASLLGFGFRWSSKEGELVRLYRLLKQTKNPYLFPVRDQLGFFRLLFKKFGEATHWRGSNVKERRLSAVRSK